MLNNKCMKRTELSFWDPSAIRKLWYGIELPKNGSRKKNINSTNIRKREKVNVLLCLFNGNMLICTPSCHIKKYICPAPGRTLICPITAQPNGIVCAEEPYCTPLLHSAVIFALLAFLRPLNTLILRTSQGQV